MAFDLFSSNPMWTVSSLTLALNRTPYVPGIIGRLGLFREERLATTTTMVEVQGFRLALVPEVPRGSPPVPNVHDLATAAAIPIPHFPKRDTLIADSIQNIRAFGTDSQLEGIQTVINRRIEAMSRDLDVTLEFLRLGAIRGKVITAVDRITGAAIVERDIFRLFGLTANDEIPWPIRGAGRIGQEASVWDSQLMRLCNALGREMADQLPGGMYAQIHILAGHEFFDEFMAHPALRLPMTLQDAPRLASSWLGSAFRFADVTIEEYRGRVGGIPFIEPDIAYAFPVGIPDLFIEAYAPADYLETVNTVALPRYAKSEVMDFDKGVMLESQMNVFPFCTLPKSLFTLRLEDFVP